MEGAVDTVTEALGARRGATVAELSDGAGLGRPSVSKALAAMETAGTAVRKPGGREGSRRLPDRWSLASAINEPTAPDAAAPGSESLDRERLGKGALGVLVLTHLAAKPSEDHGPVAVAKALGGRSSGAVGNALQRLCDTGDAVLVCESPRRYRIAEDANGTHATSGTAARGRKKQVANR